MNPHREIFLTCLVYENGPSDRMKISSVLLLENRED